MHDRGLDVPMKDVAAEVGISRQALYLHFPSRSDLLRALTIHHDLASGIGERCARAQEAPTAEEALDALIRVWFRYVEEILPVARALHAAAATDADAETAWWEAMDRGLSNTRLLVQRLDAEGVLDPLWDLEEAAQMLWSLTHVRVWDDLVEHHGWDPGQFLDRQVEVARRVLLA